MYYEGKTFKEAKKDVDSFWSYLYQKKENFDWKKTASGEIVNSENIDSYISEITPVRANTLAEEITAVQRANGSWTEFYNTLSEGEKKYVVDLVKNTQDLSKVTGDDLVQANQNARQAAIAHNAALKQQTLGAKAASVATKGLKLTLNTLASMGISFALEGLIYLFTAGDKAAETLHESLLEEVEEIDNEIVTLGSEIKSLDSLMDKINDVALSKGELAEIQKELNGLLGMGVVNLEDENFEREKTIELLEQEKKLKQDILREKIKEKEDKSFDAYETARIKDAGNAKFDMKSSDFRKYMAYDRESFSKKVEELGYDKAYEDFTSNIHSSSKGYRVMYQQSDGNGDYYDYLSGDVFSSGEAANAKSYMQEQGDLIQDIYHDAIKDLYGESSYLTTVFSGLAEAMGREAFEPYEIKAVMGQILSGYMQSVVQEYSSGKINVDEFKEKFNKVMGGYGSKGTMDNFVYAFMNEHWGKLIDYSSYSSDDKDGTVLPPTISLDEAKSASKSIKLIGDAYKQLSDDGYITLESISSIKEAVGDSVPNWEQYENILMNAKTGSSEYNQAMSDLTFAMLEKEIGLDSLANADEAYIARILEENGVLEAEKKAHEMVTMAMYKQQLQAELSDGITVENIQNLKAKALQLGLNKNAMIDLVLSEIRFNKNKLDVSQKISSLKEVALWAGVAEGKIASIMSASDTWSAEEKKSWAEQNNFDILGNDKEGQYWEHEGKTYYSWAYKDRETGEIYDTVDVPQLERAIQDEIDKVNEIEFDTSSSSSSSKSSEPKYSDFWDELLEDRENEIDAIEETIDRANTRLEYALSTGNAEQISIWTKKLEELADQKKSLLESQANGARNDLAQIMQRIWTIAPELSGKNISEISSYDIERISQSLSDNEYVQDEWNSLTDIARDYYETINEWSNEWWEAESERLDQEKSYYDNVLDTLDRYVERIGYYREQQAKALDDQITKEEALLKIKEGQFNAENKTAEVQKSIDKDIANSRNSKQYLSKDEYERIFNEEDYQRLSEDITRINGEIEDTARSFYSQIEDAYENGQLYLVEAMTAEYERQLAMKERELEIAQANVDLEKKRLNLENTLAEKNIKQYSENGITWVADQEKVKQATEDVIEAEATVKDLKKKNEQQMMLDSRQAHIDMLNSQKEAVNYQTELLNDAVEHLRMSIEDVTDPFSDLGLLIQDLVDRIGGVIGESASVVSERLSDSGINYGTGSGQSSKLGSASSSSSVSPEHVTKVTNLDGTYGYTDSENIISINGQLYDKSQTDENGLAKPIKKATEVLYDSGGIASGKGLMLKGVDEEETVLPPWLTKEVLKPEYNQNFSKLLENLQGVSHINPSDFIVKPQIASLPMRNVNNTPNITKTWTGNMYVEGGDPNEVLRVLNQAFDHITI